MLEAQKNTLEENRKIVDRFIGKISAPDELYDAWDVLNEYLSTIVQRPLSGSDDVTQKSCANCSNQPQCRSENNAMPCSDKYEFWRLCMHN